MTSKNPHIDEAKVWDEDVKAMSYDDLMAAIRFLDQERAVLAKDIHIRADNQNRKPPKIEDKAA